MSSAFKMELAFVLAVILRHLKNSKSPTVEIPNTSMSGHRSIWKLVKGKIIWNIKVLCLDCAIHKYRLLHNTNYGFTGLL